MNYLIAANYTKDEFSYQALDYYRLFEGFIEPSAADQVSEYIKEPRLMGLDKARNFTILAFRPLLLDELRVMHDDNKIIYFSDGDPHPSIALTGNAICRFITFGHRTAYRMASYLSEFNIDKPVHKIAPWVDTTGIKEYDKPPLGRVSGGGDMSIRPMLRLMAAGAIVVVPNHSPFTDMIIDGWNGIICKDVSPDFAKIGFNIKDATGISTRAKEFTNIVTSKSRYIQEFNDIVDGAAYDYNEPWVRIQRVGSEWIIPKEDVENGITIRTPKSNAARFKIMKILTLEQLLNIFSHMRFNKVYVFDAIMEEINEDNIGSINRTFKMLGDRIRNILFCFDPPDKWKMVTSRLTFMRASEAEKQVI
jgi:hypothetical protein